MTDIIERLERRMPATARLPGDRVNRANAQNFHNVFQRTSLLSRKGGE